jgi:apolipoprotein N-acyltransferase
MAPDLARTIKSSENLLDRGVRWWHYLFSFCRHNYINFWINTSIRDIRNRRFLTLMLLFVIYPLFTLVSIIRAALIYKGRISWRISAVTAAIAMIGMPLIEMLLSLSNISISIKRH